MIVVCSLKSATEKPLSFQKPVKAKSNKSAGNKKSHKNAAMLVLKLAELISVDLFPLDSRRK